jgi:hypothetical protein
MGKSELYAKKKSVAGMLTKPDRRAQIICKRFHVPMDEVLSFDKKRKN